MLIIEENIIKHFACLKLKLINIITSDMIQHILQIQLALEGNK